MLTDIQIIQKYCKIPNREGGFIKMRIVTLMENCGSEHKSLINEHGLSFYIEHGNKKYLFDCGAGDGSLKNARKLGIDLSCMDAVVLSHNHYDHAAGFRDFAECGNKCGGLYTGRHFFEKKYASSDGIKYCDLSSGISEEFLKERGIRHTACAEQMELSEGVYLVSDFKRSHAFENIPSRFVRETAEGMLQDNFSDEIAMAVETEKGLVVLVGCSHPGILNMLTSIHDRLGKPIYALFGGTHLVEADEERIHSTLEEFKRMGIEVLGMNHCSGHHAECMALETEGIKECHLAVGDTIFI